MRILIVGAGYVGSAFGKAAKERGHHITIASRTFDKIPEFLRWADDAFIWDKRIPDDIEGVLFSVAPRGASYADTYLENAKALSNAPYIVYTSSTSVYGDHGGKEVNEKTIPAPQNENQKILLETEQTLPENRSCIFRLGEITGPEKKRPIPEVIPGTGESICNFSPISLITAALLNAFETRKIGLYNLVSDEHPSRKDYYIKLAQSQGLNPPVFDATVKSQHSGNKLVTSIYR